MSECTEPNWSWAAVGGDGEEAGWNHRSRVTGTARDLGGGWGSWLRDGAQSGVWGVGLAERSMIKASEGSQDLNRPVRKEVEEAETAGPV